MCVRLENVSVPKTVRGIKENIPLRGEKEENPHFSSSSGRATVITAGALCRQCDRFNHLL